LANPLPGEKVSSSLIRKLLEAGNVTESNRLLGYAYPIMGEVITGHHAGRELGFPTANLSVESEKLLPARGVYAVWVELLNGARYRGVLNIGRRPTLHNGEDLSVEVHLLGFTGNIYAERLRLELVTRIRDEQTFDDTEQLRQQIAADCKLAEEILKLR
jgi:riboflavin kinase/FMN adenylyltransferase